MLNVLFTSDSNDSTVIALSEKDSSIVDPNVLPVKFFPFVIGFGYFRVQYVFGDLSLMFDVILDSLTEISQRNTLQATGERLRFAAVTIIEKSRTSLKLY